MRMVQAVNQGLGSPTNRINILARKQFKRARSVSGDHADFMLLPRLGSCGLKDY